MSQPHPPFGRREFLLGAAAFGLAAVPDWGIGARLAHASAPRRHRLSAVSRTAGVFEVVALLDAAGPFFLGREAAFPEATPSDWDEARRLDPGAFGADDAWNLAFHCFAIRGPGGRVVLVDTGVGPADSPAAAWAPVPGRLPEELPAAGIDPRDVETVVLTHLHEDHFGWSVDVEGVPMFPNARYVVQRREVAALAEGDAALEYVVNPLRRTGQLHELDGPARLGKDHRGPGDTITVVPTPGHTPGHQSVVVESRGRQIVVTGDVLVHAVQIADPDVSYRYEADPVLARRTRHALLDSATRNRASLATAHLTEPFMELG